MHSEIRRRVKTQTGIMGLSYFRRVFLYSTALVSAVVIAGAVIASIGARAQVLHSINESSQRELERISGAFSTLVASSIIPAAEQVYETSSVARLIYGKSPGDRERLEASQLLDRFKLANPLIDSLVVYNHQIQTFFSTRWGRRPADDPGLADLREMLGDVGRFPLYRIIPRSADGTRLFTVVVGFPPIYEKRLLGALMVNVSEPAVRAQLAGGFADRGGTFSILDNHGIILSDADPSLFGTRAAAGGTLARALASPDAQGFFDDVNARQRLSFRRDALAGWLFVSAVPDSALFGEISQGRNQLILFFGALFVVALVLAITTTRSAAIPVERLIGQVQSLRIDSLGIDPAGPAGDEVARVSETIRQLSERLRSVQRAMAAGAAHGERRALGRLFRRETLSAEERAVLVERMPIDDSCPALVVVALPECPMPAPADDHEGALRGLAGEIQESIPRVLGLAELDRGELAAVISLGADGDADAGAAEAIAALGRLAVRRAGAFTFGVSEPVDELDALSDACESAQHATHYRFRYGKGAVIPVSRCVTERPYAIPDERLRRFAEHARLLDAGQTMRIAGELLHEVTSYTWEDFIFLTQHLLYGLERLFEDSRIASPEGLAELRAYRLSTRWADTPDGVVEVLARWYSAYESRARSQAGDKSAGLVAEVKRIVSDNLGDHNLGAKLVAERAGLSVNYVRSTFKQATGESLSAYITDLRVKKCAHLLSSTDMPVKGVFTEAGFSNYTYFFTLFKKRTGCTPQEYQRVNQSH